MKRQSLTYTLLVMLMPLTTSAQNGVNSPYSRYGFGMQADKSLGFNKGMGGVAQGFREGQIINAANPASYSAVDSLTALFDLGLTLQNGNYKIGNVQQNARNTSFDYAAFHFRATKGIGIAMGLLPYTNISYNMSSSSEPLTGNSDITSSYTFNGDGGLHQAFLGAGWSVSKVLSLGLNSSFLFGDYTHTTTMAFNETNAYSLTRGYTADISTWMLDFGLQYIQPVNKTDKIILGASYGLGHNINNRAIRYTQTYNNTSSAIEGVKRDTLSNAFQLPHTFSIGLAYYNDRKFTIGADFELQKWSNCKFPTQDNMGTYTTMTNQLNDNIKGALGISYTPDSKSTRLANRITYKVGGYYSQSYANALQNLQASDKPYEFGLSAGLTIPFSNRNIWYNNIPKVNVSVQWIHSNIPYASSQNSTVSMGKLTENYMKLCIGITFSERWFYKWKME